MQKAKIKIVLNGEDLSVLTNSTVEGLLRELELATAGIAIEVNKGIIPKSQYSTTRLKEGDRLEIVHMVGGG